MYRPLDASLRYRSISQERNIAACIRNATKDAIKVAVVQGIMPKIKQGEIVREAVTPDPKLEAIVGKNNYLFPPEARPQRLDEVSVANYDTVKMLREQYNDTPLMSPLAKLERAYVRWSAYRRRQGVRQLL